MSKLIFKKKEIEGIWYSQELKQIPNYNSNFTNWVECQTTLGKLKMTISKKDEGGYHFEMGIPVLYSGAGFGYFPIKRNDVKIDKGVITIIREGEEVDQIKFKRSFTQKISMTLFETKLVFTKEH